MVTITSENVCRSEVREGSILNKPCSNTPALISFSDDIFSVDSLGVFSTSRFFETPPKGEFRRYLLSDNRDCLFPTIGSVDLLSPTLQAFPAPGSLQDRSLVDDQQNRHLIGGSCSYSFVDKKRTSNTLTFSLGYSFLLDRFPPELVSHIYSFYNDEYDRIVFYIDLVLGHGFCGTKDFVDPELLEQIDQVIDYRLDVLDELLELTPRIDEFGLDTNHLTRYISSLSAKPIFELELQSEEFRVFDVESWNEVFDSQLITNLLGKYDTVTKLIEDLGCLAYGLSMCKNKSDVIFISMNFMKLRCGDRSLLYTTAGCMEDIMCHITEIFLIEDPLTSDDEGLTNEILNSLDLQSCFLDKSRSIISMYKSLRFGPLFKRCQKLITYLIAFSIFKPLGYSLKSCGYTELEKQAIERKVWHSDEAIFHILETLQFICERGHACLTTGSIEALLHGGSSYDKFYMDCQQIKKWHPCIGNPGLMETEKITEHSFLAALDSAIERGESIFKYAQYDKNDKKVVLDMLNAMCLIRSHHMTIKYALSDRKAPLSLLLFGDSGIGKSTLTNILYVHYGKRRGQPIGDEFKYVKNPVSKYWDNFRTNMWCLVQDDIGFKKPAIAASGDETCMETIQINNSVAFTPDQASLENKGKMPFRCELVIGTTNTENLNAYNYFACPSAFQRRYPFILDVKVKPEFKNDVDMLDASKTLKVDVGDSYPDYWLWTIKRVKPRPVREVHRGYADVEILHENVGLRDFLIWYNKTIDEHHADQKITSASVEHIRDVHLCPLCGLPDSFCECQLQSDNFSFILAILLFIYWIHDSWLETYYKYTPITKKWSDIISIPYAYSWFYFKCCLVRALPERLFRKVTQFTAWRERTYEYYIRKYPRNYWRTLGTRIAYTVSQPSSISSILIVVGTILAVWKLTSRKKDIKSPQTEEVVSKTVSVNPGIVPKPAKEEPNNVWYNDSFDLHQIDHGQLSLGWNSLSLEQTHSKMALNCVSLLLKVSSTQNRRTSAFCVSGQIYLINSHFFKDAEGDVELTVYYQAEKQGVNPNLKLLVDVSTVYYKPNSDICLLELRGLPPRGNFIDLFCKESFDAKLNGHYLRRTYDGDVTAKPVERIRLQKNQYDQHTQYQMDAWNGITRSGCVVGDCGSILVVKSGFGPVILGIHYLGNPNINAVCAIKVTQEFLNEAISKMTTLMIQGNCLEVSAPSVPVNITDLHKKSAFRYLDAGSAMVCGSLTLPRAHGKSRVENTPMNSFLHQYGYRTKYTSPDLVSWRPWHLAAKEMVNPANQFKPSILRECVQAFSDDIVNNIPLDIIQDTVHVYDHFTAVNGAAGITFVDKLNRNTSMGHPYNRSKRFYIHPVAAQGENVDPVDFSEEILAKIKEIEENYRDGKRNNPVFRGNLKDEAVTELKAILGKTRLFAGAPVAWSVVVRKYVLSLIRLIQSNQYTFECACGIICQSKEWDKLKVYLTMHGIDQLVAGDFEKFDKRMCAELIQAAFDILINICGYSGNYSHEDLLVVKGIGVDTAFAWMNFNGDLVAFFGSNPSGHPLTVIINSLVNSLYMRYCFVTICGKSASEFKKFVNLMTYGDDNIMNVSRSIPEFNHTSIQLCLKNVGVGYTMADKNAPSIPYIHIDDCSFLKRTWRYDKQFGGHVAPLDHDSIEKMLMVWVRSKTISSQEQCIAVVSSAVMEYAFYGELVFDDKVRILKKMCSELDLDMYVTPSTFPTFNELVNRYQQADRRPTGASAGV
jgi:hypothetical protein